MLSYPWMVYNGKLLNLVTIVSLMVVALCRLMIAIAPSQNVEYWRRKSVRWAGMVCEKGGLECVREGGSNGAPCNSAASYRASH